MAAHVFSVCCMWRWCQLLDVATFSVCNAAAGLVSFVAPTAHFFGW